MFGGIGTIMPKTNNLNAESEGFRTKPPPNR